MIIEGLRTDSLYIGSLRVSQLIGLVSFALGAFMSVFLYIKARKAHIDAIDAAVPAIAEAEDAAVTVDEAAEEKTDTKGE